MKYNQNITLFIALAIAMLFVGKVEAGSPLWRLDPLTATQLTVGPLSTATVKYSVTNNSSRTHTLSMEYIPGITQVTSGGNCSDPFVLPANQSCTLELSISGADLVRNVLSGPRICEQGADGLPSPMLCYQPSVANSLLIAVSESAT